MRTGPDKRAGQSVSETILLMPLFLLLIFGALQLGQLGVALIVANYAASAAARQMVQDNTTTPQGFDSRFNSLLTAGMKNKQLEVSSASGADMIKDITVHACADVDAFPFIGTILARPLSGLRGGGCGSIGIVSFTPSPPSFTVHGRALARMNYQAH